jgi:arylformamidase
MRIYDITAPLSPSLPVYPGDPEVTVTPIAQLRWGDAANVSRLGLSSHTGTHLDAPRHFFEAGVAIDGLDLRLLMGPARVCAFPQATTHLTADDLRPLELVGVQRLLLQTANAALWEKTGFQANYIALTESAAHLLVEVGVRLVGIDYLSVDAFERQDFPVHRILLEAEVLILEGLDLRTVPPGDYELLALPLLLAHGDGAPARAILRRP